MTKLKASSLALATLFLLTSLSFTQGQNRRKPLPRKPPIPQWIMFAGGGLMRADWKIDRVEVKDAKTIVSLEARCHKIQGVDMGDNHCLFPKFEDSLLLVDNRANKYRLLSVGSLPSSIDSELIPKPVTIGNQSESPQRRTGKLIMPVDTSFSVILEFEPLRGFNL